MEETVLLTCAKGVPPILARELVALGFPVLREDAALVETRADLVGQIRLLLHVRTAHRVLVRVLQGRALHPDDLYSLLSRHPWEKDLGPDGYLRIHGHVHTPTIRDPRFAFLKAKDAVMDRLRSVYGRRPDSGPDDHGAAIYLHWVGDQVAACLDLSGPPLSRRGYRAEGGPAPLQEALAAALLLAGEWPLDRPLVNPMCGSGTLAIEAALLATHRAPGAGRGNFGLFHLRRHDPALWRRELTAARSGTHAPPPLIVATDIDPDAVETARRNALRADVADLIRFEVCDFRKTPVPEGAWVALNPPYGLRLDAENDLAALYADIGAWLKGLHSGGKALVISGNLPLSKRFGLRLDAKHTLYNGPVECRLLRFPLPVRGTP